MDKHLSRFVQFAVNVMGIANDFSDPKATAERGIVAIERFYKAIGMPTSIPELIGREVTDDEIKEMARKCSRDGQITIGAMEVLRAKDMEAIYRMANTTKKAV